MDMPTFANDLLRGVATAQRVTDFRLDVLQITDADYWKLPDRARAFLRIYARELPAAAPGVWRFEMAIDCWPDLEAAMRVLPCGCSRLED